MTTASEKLMTPSDYHPSVSEDLLNPLSRIMYELKKIKEQEEQIKCRKELLKEELNAHRYYGNIKNEFESEGIKVIRTKVRRTYEFSEMVLQLRQEVKKREAIEIEDEIAIASPVSYTWQVRAVKE